MVKKTYIKLITFILLFSAAEITIARPPDSSVSGKLVFLGKTHDLSESVWLSVTTAGSFKLEAQGQQVIDAWQKSQRGVHLSLSPIVSQGNGGTHFLINAENNRKLDQQNQQGGIIFPPIPIDPPIISHPIPPIPAHPIVIPPGKSPIISNPIPPIPAHPIVIPPGKPPVVSHPIPPIPAHPIVIPPGKPPVVSHPIPPIPAHPIVIPPGKPPVVSHPIPPIPAHPIGMPPASKNVSPLPDFLNNMRIQPQHYKSTPTERLPLERLLDEPSALNRLKNTMKRTIYITLRDKLKSIMLTNSLHSVSEEITTESMTDYRMMVASNQSVTKYPQQVSESDYLDPSLNHGQHLSIKRQRKAREKVLKTNATNNNLNADQQVPITEARHFAQESPWNIWSDNRYFNLSDNRNNLDSKGKAIDLSIGIDRYIGKDIILGGLLTLVKFNNAAFDGDITNRAVGFKVGPYFGLKLSHNWSADGVIAYGMLENNNHIASLESKFTTQLLNGTLRGMGLYKFGSFQILPKPLVSHTYFRNPSYQFNGFFTNRAVQIDRPKESFNFGFVELRLEANYEMTTKKGSVVQPYVEAGIDYAYELPNDGQVLTGNLTLASISRFTETLTAGVRAQLDKAFLIDAAGGYLSFGQHGLDVWELRLLVSYSFS